MHKLAMQMHLFVDCLCRSLLDNDKYVDDKSDGSCNLNIDDKDDDEDTDADKE
jgi:hypothetical protein